MRHTDPPPSRPSRLPYVLAAAAIVPLVIAGIVAVAITETFGGTQRPEILAAMKRDPMAHYTPPLETGVPRSIETEDSAAFGFRTQASVRHNYTVRATDARLSFLAAVLAAHRAGWQTKRDRYTDIAALGSLGAVTSVRAPEALRDHGVQLSITLRRGGSALLPTTLATTTGGSAALPATMTASHAGRGSEGDAELSIVMTGP